VSVNKERIFALTREVAPQYLVALYLVLVLTVGFVVSSLVLQPQELRIAAISRQLSQEQQKLALIEKFILTYPNGEKRLNELQQSLLRVEKALPGSLDVSAFMAQLERDAQAAGVRLVNLKPSLMVDRAGYRELPIEVSLEGGYFQTMSFLKKLEDGERFSLPAAFLIQKKLDKLSTRLNLQIFCYGITPKATSGVVQPAVLPVPPALPAR
jgi:type IV pilus assembly protein PilO